VRGGFKGAGENVHLSPVKKNHYIYGTFVPPGTEEKERGRELERPEKKNTSLFPVVEGMNEGASEKGKWGT